MTEILNMADMGDVIRTERKARRLTQSALAMMAGLSRQTIINIEEGNDSGLLSLMKILRAMDLRLEARPAAPDFTQLGKLLDES